MMKMYIAKIGVTIMLVLFGSAQSLRAQHAVEEPELIRRITIETNIGTSSLSIPVLSPDGSMYAMTEAGGVTVRGTESGKEIYSVKSKTGKSSVIAFSPDGKQIAFNNSKSYAVTICDAATGQKTAEINLPDGKKHRSSVNDVSRSHSADMKALSHVQIIKYFPDEKRIAFGVRNDMSNEHGTVDTIVIYDIETDTVLREWDVKALMGDEHTGIYYQTPFSVSPNGKYVAFGGNSYIRNSKNVNTPGFVLDIKTGDIICKLVNSTAGVSFSSDSRKLLYYDIVDRQTMIFDMCTKETKVLSDSPMAFFPVFSSNSRYMFSLAIDGINVSSPNLVGIDIETGKIVYKQKFTSGLPDSPASTVFCARIMQSSSKMPRGTYPNLVMEQEWGIYEMSSLDTLARRIEQTRQATPVEAESSNSSAGQSIKWKYLRTIASPLGPVDHASPDFSSAMTGTLALSPDGRYIASSYYKYVPVNKCDSHYVVWDTQSGQEVTRIPNGNPSAYAAFLPNGKELAVVQNLDKLPVRLLLVDMATWKVSRSVKATSYDPQFSPDVRFLCFRSSGEVTKPTIIVDLLTGKEQSFPNKNTQAKMVLGDKIFATISSPSSPVNPMAPKSTLTFYNIASGKKVGEMKNSPISDLRIFPDERRILCPYFVSGGIQLVVMDILSGEILGRIGEKYDSVGFHAGQPISPDGKRIYLPQNNGSVVVYDAETYKELDTVSFREFADAKNPISLFVSKMAISQDGKTLAVKTSDRFILFTAE